MAKETEKKATKEKTTKKSVVKKNESEVSKIAHNVIVRPLISEKSSFLAAENKYVFVVNSKTNRSEVKKAIKELYDVTPTQVNIMNMAGKRVRFKGIRGKRSDWKKAIVTIPKDATINVFEGV